MKGCDKLSNNNDNQQTGLISSLKDQLSTAGKKLSELLSVKSGVTQLISETKKSLSELKEVNTLLTKISITNDKLSKADLERIGNNSIDIAGKYGKKSTDYLSGVREAYNLGYDNAEDIAELSLAIQCAGDMTSELANQYINATDKAYEFGGSASKLQEVLDGCNYIADHNTINMTELAQAMTIAGSQAASLGVEAGETTAALGTMLAATQQSGSETANAFNAILLNIRQVTDEEAGINAEGLARYANACKDLNVSLNETKNGITSLRDPMEVIKELAAEYSKLDSGDVRRTNLLDSVGGGTNADSLNAILENYDMYENMLKEYAAGTGSMAKEAEILANTWEGSMNRLSNSWTDTVGNIAESDVVIAAVNGLNALLSVVNNVTDKLGSIKTIGIGAGITSFVKNFA